MTFSFQPISDLCTHIETLEKGIPVWDSIPAPLCETLVSAFKSVEESCFNPLRNACYLHRRTVCQSLHALENELYYRVDRLLLQSEAPPEPISYRLLAIQKVERTALWRKTDESFEAYGERRRLCQKALKRFSKDWAQEEGEELLFRIARLLSLLQSPPSPSLEAGKVVMLSWEHRVYRTIPLETPHLSPEDPQPLGIRVLREQAKALQSAVEEVYFKKKVAFSLQNSPPLSFQERLARFKDFSASLLEKGDLRAVSQFAKRVRNWAETPEEFEQINHALFQWKEKVLGELDLPKYLADIRDLETDISVSLEKGDVSAVETSLATLRQGAALWKDHSAQIALESLRVERETQERLSKERAAFPAVSLPEITRMGSSSSGLAGPQPQALIDFLDEELLKELSFEDEMCQLDEGTD